MKLHGVRFAVVLAVLMSSGSALSQSLWREVEYGMTAEQVRMLYPAGQYVTHSPTETSLEEVQIAEGCEADVRIFHEQGTVERVVLRGGGSLSGRCANRIFDALSARYGEALSREGRRGILRRPSRDYVWNRDGVVLRFRRFEGNDYGGGGLLRASWELTYSRVEENIDL